MKKSRIIALIAIIFLVIFLAICIRYAVVLKEHGYRPESVADFFWQGSHWAEVVDMETQNFAEYPLTDDLTIRCSIEKEAIGRFAVDYLRVNSILGAYYIHTRRDSDATYGNVRHDLGDTAFRVAFDIIERPDFLVLLVKSELLFIDSYGEPAFTHTHGENHPNQYGNIDHYQYFILPLLDELPDDYVISGGPFSFTKADIVAWLS